MPPWTSICIGQAPVTEGRGERPRGRGDHGTSACHTGELGFVLKGIGAPRAVALNILGVRELWTFYFPVFLPTIPERTTDPMKSVPGGFGPG